MLDRRQFLQVAAAAAVLTGVPGLSARSLARQSIKQRDLLAFEPVGQVTLLNFTDCHAQLVPLYFREPSVNLGVGDVYGLPPHITGKDLLTKFGLKAGSPEAYAFSSVDFANLAKTYGRVGGLDRLATLIKAIRAQRPNNTLLLDGGDTWQGSYTALKTRGEDMVDIMNALGVEAMTAHWEFTYGTERVEELKDKLKFPFLAGNVRDTEWEEEVFDSTSFFERSGVKIAVIGQAFPVFLESGSEALPGIQMWSPVGHHVRQRRLLFSPLVASRPNQRRVTPAIGIGYAQEELVAALEMFLK